MEKLTEILLKVYEPRFEETFKYHPDKDYIIERLREGSNPPDLVDRWFKEAEWCTQKRIFSQETVHTENEYGTVTFKVVNNGHADSN